VHRYTWCKVGTATIGYLSPERRLHCGLFRAVQDESELRIKGDGHGLASSGECHLAIGVQAVETPVGSLWQRTNEHWMCMCMCRVKGQGLRG
jgi:hypothetical protein